MIVNSKRLLANSVRRAIMQAWRRPSRRRHSYAQFAVNSIVGTMAARAFFRVVR